MTTVRQLIEGKDDVFILSPSDSVMEALFLIANKHVGAVSVVDKGKLVGVFSERDHVRKIALCGRDPHATRVADVMTSPVITVSPESTLDECMVLMTQRHIRHLPVVDNKRVIGMISMRDVVRHLLSDKQQVIEQLEQYIMAG